MTELVATRERMVELLRAIPGVERVTAAFGNLDESEKRTFSELCRKLAA